LGAGIEHDIVVRVLHAEFVVAVVTEREYALRLLEVLLIDQEHPLLLLDEHRMSWTHLLLVVVGVHAISQVLEVV
jgi:hypothetical protein